jgi:hypothetical protein
MQSVLPRQTNGRFLTMAFAVSTAALATGCGQSAVLTRLTDAGLQPPAALTKPCDDVGDLPAGALSAGVVERLWARDRAALADCGTRHDETVQFYAERDRRLSK